MQGVYAVSRQFSKSNRKSRNDCNIYQNSCTQNAQMRLQAGRTDGHKNSIRQFVKRKCLAGRADAPFSIRIKPQILHKKAMPPFFDAHRLNFFLKLYSSRRINTFPFRRPCRAHRLPEPPPRVQAYPQQHSRL